MKYPNRIKILLISMLLPSANIGLVSFNFLVIDLYLFTIEILIKILAAISCMIDFFCKSIIGGNKGGESDMSD